MKVLYISGPSFLDMDLSFVRALNEVSECYYLMDLYPKLHKATALDLDHAPAEADLIPLHDFEGMGDWKSMLDAGRSFVINRTSNNPFSMSNLALQWKLHRFIERIDPDVIHFNNQIYFNHFHLFLRARKVVISIHDPFPHSGEEGDTRTLSAKVYRWLNCRFIRHHMLYNGIMSLAYANDRGISPDRVITSRLGPYEYLRTIRRKEGDARCDFLCFGRIQRYKGIDLLLEAFVKVIRHHPEATLTIAGSGEFWFDVDAYAIPAKNLRILNRFIPGDELAALLEGAGTVVCPYRDATQSGVVMSAYAFHRPVIVSNVGALPEVVEHGKSGLIVEAGNVDELADAMVRCLGENGELKGAEASIDEVFHKGPKSWRSIATGILEEYRKVIRAAC